MGGKCEYYALICNLGTLLFHDFDESVSGLARTQGRDDLIDRAQLRSPDLDRACGIEADVAPMRALP